MKSEWKSGISLILYLMLSLVFYVVIICLYYSCNNITLEIFKYQQFVLVYIIYVAIVLIWKKLSAECIVKDNCKRRKYKCYIKNIIIKKYIINKRVIKKCIIEYDCKCKKDIYKSNSYGWIMNIFSVDYFLSDFYKKKYFDKHTNVNYKAGRTQFINVNNRVNLIFSGVLILLLAVLKEWLLRYIKIFILFRVVSRSFEIIFAFTNDIISSEEKKSNLVRSERIKLALKSYFEIIILYAWVYLILGNGINISCSDIIDSFFSSFGMASLVSVDLSLIKKIELEPFFKVLEIITSMSLIYFALAGYIGETQVRSNHNKNKLR